MKATFPFAYKAQVLFPRSDTPKDEVFTETLTVDIPELRSVEVPVALDYVTLPYGNEMSVRLHDDVFLSKVSTRASGSLELSALGSQSCGSPPSLIVEAQHHYGSREYNAMWSWYKDPKQSQSGRDPAKVREWFHSGRDAARLKASRFYENLVAIDGIVWLPIFEPKVGVYVGQQPSIGMPPRHRL